MSDASMSREDEQHVFQIPAPHEDNAALFKLLEQQGIYKIITMLATLADDIAYETQDHDDDLICMVLEKAEKQIWGLTLSQQHRKQNHGQMELAMDRTNEQRTTR